MDTDLFDIQIYATEDGFEPFKDWIDSLKNLETRALIFQRIQRIKLGHFGDCKPIQDGLWEFRIHYGSGYRIYYSRTGNRVILFFCGGSKGSQKKDIKLAMKYLEDYRSNYEK
jgi:putative addiction module killer protein